MYRGPVLMRLVVPNVPIAGETEIVALWEIKREAGWHTYWEHPGDVGVAPSLIWELPEGFVGSALSFPPPQRVDMASTGAYGHQGETLFLSTIKTPKLRNDDEIKLKAKVSWLACSHICQPDQGELVLTFTVGERVPPTPLWEEKLRNFRHSQPTALPDGSISQVERVGEFLKLTIHNLGESQNEEFDFFAENRIIRSNEPPRVRKIQSGVEMLMQASPWKTQGISIFSGLLKITSSQGSSRYHRVEVPLEK